MFLQPDGIQAAPAPVERSDFLPLAFAVFFPACRGFRGRGAGWQRGQKWLLRPATIMRRIFSRQRTQGFPSRW